MKNFTGNRNRRPGLASFASFAVLFAGFIAPNAMADHGWPQIASGGSVDDSDVGICKKNGVTVSIRLNAKVKSTLNIRYSVPNIDGLNEGSSGPVHGWEIRYRDNGDDARVLLKVKRYNLRTGAITTLWTFDSDNYAPSSKYQNVFVQDDTGTWQFSYGGIQVYYVEAIISRSSRDGKPGLGGFYMIN